MAIKLFVTDMDGTLLNREHRISEENKQAIREAAEAGVIVTIATGRTYGSTLNVPIITYNGAVIRTVAGEDLFTAYLDEKIVTEVLQYCFARNWYVQVYAHDGNEDRIYIDQACEQSRNYESSIGAVCTPAGRDGMLEKTKNVPKILVVTAGTEETLAVIADLGEAFRGRVFPVKSSAIFAEVNSKGVNKGSSVLRLAERFGIQPDEIMVIGDSANDLAMMRVAGHSVAMGNADADVKAVCEYVTGDCDDSGVAQAIRKYVLG